MPLKRSLTSLKGGIKGVNSCVLLLLLSSLLLYGSMFLRAPASDIVYYDVAFAFWLILP